MKDYGRSRGTKSTTLSKWVKERRGIVFKPKYMRTPEKIKTGFRCLLDVKQLTRQ
jgi:hypothetical protein